MTTASTVRAEGARYRIDRPTFSVIMRDLRIPGHDLGPGDKVPHIDLPTTEGGRFTTDSIAADGRPVLLVFGSLTCPATESAGRGLVDLHRTYGDTIPASASRSPSTTSTARCTGRSARGPAPRTSSSPRAPSCSGHTGRTSWSRSRRRCVPSSRAGHCRGRRWDGRAQALVRMAAYADVPLDAAGRGARRDFWRAAPPAAAMITLARLFRFLR